MEILLLFASSFVSFYLQDTQDILKIKSSKIK